MGTPYRPQATANFFLSKAAEDGVKLDQLKLGKLVYIAYGWVLAVLDEILFEEEIQAWKFGPVVPSIYHEFKKFGRSPVKGKSTHSEVGEDWFIRVTTPEIPHSDDDVNQVLQKVWMLYKPYSGVALIRKTHEKGTPWESVHKKEERNIVIPDELIKPHFQSLIRAYISRANSKEKSAA